MHACVRACSVSPCGAPVPAGSLAGNVGRPLVGALLLAALVFVYPEKKERERKRESGWGPVWELWEHLEHLALTAKWDWIRKVCIGTAATWPRPSAAMTLLPVTTLWKNVTQCFSGGLKSPTESGRAVLFCFFSFRPNFFQHEATGRERLVPPGFDETDLSQHFRKAWPKTASVLMQIGSFLLCIVTLKSSTAVVGAQETSHQAQGRKKNSRRSGWNLLQLNTVTSRMFLPHGEIGDVAFDKFHPVVAPASTNQVASCGWKGEKVKKKKKHAQPLVVH